MLRFAASIYYLTEAATKAKSPSHFWEAPEQGDYASVRPGAVDAPPSIIAGIVLAILDFVLVLLPISPITPFTKRLAGRGRSRSVTLRDQSHSICLVSATAKSMKANIVSLIVFALTLILLAIRYAHAPWTAMRIAAVVLGLPSLALLVVARIELGGAFSVRPKAQALVTHGLYSRIRNPIYVFGTLTIVACFLYIRQPLCIFLLLVLIPLQVYRARQEEKILEDKFGEEYRQYKARTWF